MSMITLYQMTTPPIPGHDELCSVPDHSNCFYCDSHNCTQVRARLGTTGLASLASPCPDSLAHFGISGCLKYSDHTAQCNSHNNKCTQGCASDANCPESYPLCGAVLPHRCGCSDNSDCKVLSITTIALTELFETLAATRSGTLVITPTPDALRPLVKFCSNQSR